MTPVDKLHFVVPVGGSHHALYTDIDIVTVDTSTGRILSIVPIPKRADVTAFKADHPPE